MDIAHTSPIRLIVVGTSCSGKSTFSARLASALQLPRVELDRLYWGENWQPKPKAEFVRLIDEQTAGESWIVDGTYGSVRDHLWPKATHIIWLNYSLALTLWRGLRRTLARCISGDELWHGNRETFRRSFTSKESILVWIISTHSRRRREIGAQMTSGPYTGLHWQAFKHPAQAERCLKSLEHEPTR